MRFYYTDRKGELCDVGAERFSVHGSGALIFSEGSAWEPAVTLIVAPGDWHDLTPGGDE